MKKYGFRFLNKQQLYLYATLGARACPAGKTAIKERVERIVSGPEIRNCPPISRHATALAQGRAAPARTRIGLRGVARRRASFQKGTACVPLQDCAG
ncbi:hypothetical protein CW354_17235 [Marinicaulis flavus]|uniref:Uncharacterized protein n=1 Tax=Hyphococcus luteus TaxID=2058213 RepID=A0A2S7K0R4_9PROT|nr:hypothetical protein CW354_17235 [Marinicaulis flavus]